MGRMKDVAIDLMERESTEIAEGDAIFILGAGFSKGIYNKMPSMTELSKECEARLAAAGLQGFGDDFEMAMNYLAQSHPWITSIDRLRNQALLKELTADVATVIRRRMSAARTLACPPWLREIMQYWVDTDCGVITLNYDTMLESFAQETLGFLPDPPNGFWQVDEDYDEDVIKAFPVFSRFKSGPSRKFRLFKLHGSLNWYYSGNLDYENETIYYVKPSDRSDDAAHLEPNSILSASDQVRAGLSEFIVPPLFEKTTFYNHRVLRREWALASRTLSRAKEVYLWGYSLPISDLTMRYFLNTPREDAEMPTLYVVDVDKKLPARLKKLLKGQFRVNSSLVGPDCGARLAVHLAEKRKATTPPGYGAYERVDPAIIAQVGKELWEGGRGNGTSPLMSSPLMAAIDATRAEIPTFPRGHATRAAITSRSRTAMPSSIRSTSVMWTLITSASPPRPYCRTATGSALPGTARTTPRKGRFPPVEARHIRDHRAVPMSIARIGLRAATNQRVCRRPQSDSRHKGAAIMTLDRNAYRLFTPICALLLFGGVFVGCGGQNQSDSSEPRAAQPPEAAASHALLSAQRNEQITS